MASSSSSPLMAASSEATTKPVSSVVVPLEGLVIPASAVIETTGGDHNMAALDPLEEEPDSHKGDWRDSDIIGRDIQEMVAEGYLPATEGLAWRAAPADEVIPSPQAEEKVYLKAQLVRGVSMPISNFFLSVLNHFKVQPHNLSPNSILVFSNFAALCEGYLGIRPRLDLFVYFFTVKREAGHSREELRNCGTISFNIRPGRRFPDIVGHESCKNWQRTYFYGPDIPLAGREATYPDFVDGAAAEVSSWRSHASLPSDLDASRAIRQIEWFVETGLTGLDLAMCWFIRRIQPLQHCAKYMHEYTSDRRDSLRISVDNFSSDSVKLRLKDIVKVKDKKRGFTITYDMFVDGKCPKVGFYFPCTTYTPVLPSCKCHFI